jgi:hypothetical protein
MTAVLEDALEFKISEWKTLNTAASPNKLPAGHSPNNQNVWMDEKPGSVVTANGYNKLGQIPSGNPVTGLINFFKSSTGESQLICTDGQNVYATTDFVTFTTVTTGLSEFFQLRGKVIRDKLWLTNGSDPVMTWDGSTLTQLDGTGGKPNVPKGKFIEYNDERVWLYGIDGDLSAMRFTALADSSGVEIAPTHASAWPTDNEIQISEGDADIGTGIFLYRGYLYCSKQYSIWRIVGYDEYTYTRVKTRASTGTRFQESIQIKDNLVHFIGVDGLYVFDGEEAKRISDIVDPATSEEGVFAFRNLQQPLLNNQFWNVSDTAAFAAGTDPANLSTDDDKLTLIPADDSQANFNAGTLTNTTADDNPGSLQLSRSDSTSQLITSGLTGLLPGSSGVPALSVIGVASSLIDQVGGVICGYQVPASRTFSNTVIFEVDMSEQRVINKITLQQLYFTCPTNPDISGGVVEVDVDGSGTWTQVATGGPSQLSNYGPTDTSITFTRVLCRKVRFRITINGTTSATNASITVTEMFVYDAGYSLTGSFISKSLDYGATPATFGNLAASIVTNSETYQFSTQSSADGSTWDSAVNVANGGAIGSTLKRYLRWRVTLNSSTGFATPVIDKVYVGGTYLSEIHDTGGNIFAWAPFQSSFNKSGQTIVWYYRAAATSGAISGASWTAIVPGASPATSVSNPFIQIKIEMSTADSTQIPFVESFTVNWILDSGSGVNTLQNVASIIILNRYWLAAATLGADANDIVIVLGKSSAESPFHQKDFEFLSFCRYQDFYIGGSSTDGSLYRLETGFSKNGSALDSLYETADFSKEGFQIKGRELHVTCDRSGPYSLFVGWSTDGGLTWTEKELDLTRADGDSLSFTKKFNISFLSDTVRFRVRINEADQPYSVDELKCYYRLTPQRGTLVMAA